MLSYVLFDIASGNFISRNKKGIIFVEELENLKLVINGDKDDFQEYGIKVWLSDPANPTYSKVITRVHWKNPHSVTSTDIIQAIAEVLVDDLSDELNLENTYLVPFCPLLKEVDFVRMFRLGDWDEPDLGY